MIKSVKKSLLAFLFTSVTCGSSAWAQTFEIDAQSQVYAGDPVDVVVSGLPPEVEVTLQARRVLKNHYAPGAPTQTYKSSALFRADADGRVDTSTTVALEGSYQGVDQNGLLWSMRPVSDEMVSPSARLELEASIDGVVVAASGLDLIQVPKGYAAQEIEALPGSYFAANLNPGDHPVIIIVGGADALGVKRDTVMPQFVAKGYSVFYFATYEIIYGSAEPTVKGLPTRYVDISIDQLDKVRDWLSKQPGVDESRIGLYGHSRNAAYVLLAATQFDWVDAVAAIAPSDVVWEGWGDGVALGTTSSFSWGGEPLPYVPYSKNWYRETAKFGRGERGRLRTPMDEGRWENLDRVAAARIPIERYKGAVLVVGGELDDLWSAGHMAQNIAERRAEEGLETELLVFPDAGHDLISDGQNPIMLLYQDNATRPILAKAQAQTWQTTLDFFDQNLR
ncbi:MAG: acyl-CoA thioesterase/bile acid-CoA:amino acid N-acyltransferase family protein [Pseudomonadota bacterium]